MWSWQLCRPSCAECQIKDESSNSVQLMCSHDLFRRKLYLLASSESGRTDVKFTQAWFIERPAERCKICGGGNALCHFFVRIFSVSFVRNKHKINRSRTSRFTSVHPQIFRLKPLVRIFFKKSFVSKFSWKFRPCRYRVWEYSVFISCVKFSRKDKMQISFSTFLNIKQCWARRYSTNHCWSYYGFEILRAFL